jgi:hypothetical protein
MVGVSLICVSVVALVIGTVAHFSILARLEGAGHEVKYFANVWDNVRAYRKYRRLAPDQRWPMWPSYAVLAVYAGVLLAGLAFLLDSPVPRIARWLKW